LACDSDPQLPRLGSFCYDVDMIFITGASSTGKSTLIKHLKEVLPKDKYDVHDIDEADLWTDDYPAWRNEKIDYWLKQSLTNTKAGITTILGGIIYPDNVMQAPTYEPDIPLSYILLHASPEVITQRFNSRYSTKKRAAMTAEQRTELETRLKRQIEISDELKTAYEKLQGVTIIDTSDLSPEEVLRKVQHNLD
jgi:thymidylate kinase